MLRTFFLPPRKVINPGGLQEVTGHWGHLLIKKIGVCVTHWLTAWAFALGKQGMRPALSFSGSLNSYFLICKMASSIPTLLPGLKKVMHTNCLINLAIFFPRGCKNSIMPKTVSVTVPVCLVEPFGKSEHKVSLSLWGPGKLGSFSSGREGFPKECPTSYHSVSSRKFRLKFCSLKLYIKETTPSTTCQIGACHLS